MNNFKVEIYEKDRFVDCSNRAVFPLKIADLLDEQLDECELIIKRSNKPYIKPLTRVKITLINNPKAKFTSDYASKKTRNKDISFTYNDDKTITETLSREFVVASDNPIEQPVGSGKYNHQIYLIEITKILEGYIGDSISFTNSLGNNVID